MSTFVLMKNIEADIAELFRLLIDQKGFHSLVFMKKMNPLKAIEFESKSERIGAKEFEPIYFSTEKESFPTDDISLLEQLTCNMENTSTTSLSLKDTLLKKGVLISIPLRFDAFHIGYIACLFNQKSINQTTEATIEYFSSFICNSLQQQYQLNKKSRELSNAKKNLAASSKIINSLKIRLEEKSKALEDANNNKVNIAKVKWDKNTVQLDEVWLTMQGYSKENMEPVVSKWCKIEDLDIYKQVNELLQFQQVKKVKRLSVSGR